jgi:hypothetical protein
MLGAAAEMHAARTFSIADSVTTCKKHDEWPE